MFIVFCFGRLVLLAFRLGPMIGSSAHYDYRHFLELAQLSDRGLYPYLQYWVEYPPVFAWLSVGLYRLSTALASGLGIEAWYYALTGLLRVSAEAGMLWLIYRISRSVWGPEGAWRSAVCYTLLFVPYYVWNGAFDSLPAFLLLLALYLFILQRETLSAIVAGMGIATKLFPGLLVPLAVCLLPGLGRRLKYAIVAAGTVAVVILPLFIASPSMTFASMSNLLGRSSWETVWAVIDGYYGPGAVASIEQRLDPSAALIGAPSILPWTLITIVFAGLFLLFYARFRGRRTPLQLTAATGVTLHLLILFSKGYSPQYLIWLAPILVITFPNVKGATYLVLLGIVNLLEYPVYFHFLPNLAWFLTIIVIGRTALLIFIGIDYLRVAIGAHPQTSATEALYV
ncbi:MAG TPA: glycosyltransferase 87 family protein [Anaerolineae bacterium]